MQFLLHPSQGRVAEVCLSQSKPEINWMMQMDPCAETGV